MATIKIGFVPTRRSIFSAPDAVRFADLTREKLNEMGVTYVDVNDINEEGLLYDESDRLKVLEKFKQERVDKDFRHLRPCGGHLLFGSVLHHKRSRH